MKMTFNQWVFTKLNPRMYCKPTANGFMLVPASRVEAGQETPWMYALVNRDEQMYDMAFTNEEQLIDSIFKAKEIWYGNQKYPNELFDKRYEMKVLYDLLGKS